MSTNVKGTEIAKFLAAQLFSHNIKHGRNEDCKLNPLRLFITGSAGTGKSLLIRELNQTLIWSYYVHLQLKWHNIQDLSAEVTSTIPELQVVIIDEISMVSSRQLLWIDKRL
ncbi:hypothetical protein INT48_004806 [Thamnidium elegans]|uniref:ATP-dependent DNA helicase n=1 Tax=Thamnidium elegans TaxID=101142 RepID=A0A8H7VRG7_9FUNG|nr:hypothetical protein INT48_004806 [Thamnidium elegans]